MNIKKFRTTHLRDVYPKIFVTLSSMGKFDTGLFLAGTVACDVCIMSRCDVCM
jgi:hypothetical protein